MKWEANDLERYLSAKEYIDTAIIPLQPFQLFDEEKLEEDAFQREVLKIFSLEIEKELSGRTMLTPTYNYLKSSDISNEITRLNSWIEEINHQPFKTIILLTFESKWKKVEKELNGSMIWLPGIKSGDLRSPETLNLIKNQVEQTSELIKSYW